MICTQKCAWIKPDLRFKKWGRISFKIIGDEYIIFEDYGCVFTYIHKLCKLCEFDIDFVTDQLEYSFKKKKTVSLFFVVVVSNIDALNLQFNIPKKSNMLLAVRTIEKSIFTHTCTTRFLLSSQFVYWYLILKIYTSLENNFTW